MCLKKWKFILVFFAVVLLMVCNTASAQAYQSVKLQQQQLMADFERDGVYDPFFVKGVGYAPILIGKFRGSGSGWSAVCQYAGPYPLQYPELRFEPGATSPDGKFTCGTNGESFYDNTAVLNRDLPLIKNMKANTIRTWGNVTPAFMQKANEYGLKVIAGYWVDHNIDYTFSSSIGPQQRQALIDDFVKYVNAFKNEPALLMWGVSNENNLDFCNPCFHSQTCDRTAQAAGYYQLMNDMALAAKKAEGASFHPVMIVSAELTADLINSASYIPDVDIIGINSYRGSSFAGYPAGKPNLFDEFAINFFDKSMIVTEFGADAWNSGSDPAHPENGVEDQTSQAIYISSAWDEIAQNATINGGPANGGVVFHYSDQWNGYGQRPASADPNDSCVWVSSDWTPSVVTHDYNYTDPAVFGIGAMPDNKVNPEWWGITSVEQNLNGSACATPAGVDCVYPRTAYYALQQKFANNAPVLYFIGNKSVDAGVNLAFTISGTTFGAGTLTYSASGLPSGATFNASTRTFSWTPASSQGGTYKVTFTLSDGSLTDSETIAITVKTTARIVAPTPGSQITTTNVTFSWSANPVSTGYYLWVGTAPNTNNLRNLSAGMSTSIATTVPLDGNPLYVSVWSRVNNVWVKDHEVSYTRSAPVSTPARITSPTPGSRITTSSVTFSWSANPASTQYYLWVGTAPNTNNLRNLNAGTATSITTTVTLDGNPLYVSVWSLVNGTWVKDHEVSYTRSAPVATPARITSPTPGSRITTSSVTFSWSANPASAQYYLWLGTAANTNNLGNINAGTSTSRTVTVTLDGNPLYVSVWSLVNGTWVKDHEVSYTRSAPVATPARITSPTPGSQITTSSVTFSWSANPASTQYYLWVGTAPNTNNLRNLNAGTSTSITTTVTLDGNPLYVSIWSKVNGVFVKDHEVSYTRSAPVASPARITSPTPGSQITTSSVTFAWTANPASAQYYLWLGTAANTNNLGNISAGTSTSITTTVTLDGNPLYVSIWSKVNNVWVKDHEVTYSRSN